MVKSAMDRLRAHCEDSGMPTGHARNRHCGYSRLSRLTAGAVSAERLRRHMAKSGRTLAGQKLWTKADIEHLRRAYPDYRKARALLPSRSLSAIKSKAFRLRITRAQRIWSDNDVKRLKVPYRSGRPMRSGWRRPQTPPKTYELKPYDDV